MESTSQVDSIWVLDMKRYNNLWNQLISFENIFLAFRNAVKGKGNKPYVLAFVMNLEHNLVQLQSDLVNKSYQPGKYNTFFIYEPKKRMISAAPFWDRIVHHCLINIIGPIFEATFIQQSYANQVGKGTHRAIRDVQSAMRLDKYVLHCDIKKYFPSIDQIKHSFQSWLGHAKQAHTCALRKGLLKKISFKRNG